MDRRNLRRRGTEAVLSEVSLLQDLREIPTGIIQIVDFFQEPSQLIMITEYAQGGDLMTRILRGPKLSEHNAKQLFRSMLMGLRELHARRVCHRNLQPQNVVITYCQEKLGALCLGASIIDFGSATKLPEFSRYTTAPCKTSSFTAPEILQKRAYDTQSDMWSLGVIVYYALVGRLPFEASSKKELYQKIIKADYTFQSKEWSGISKSAKRFVSALLHADPTVRMTADETLEHPWLADLTPVARVSEGAKEGQNKSFGKSKLMKHVWRAVSASRSNYTKTRGVPPEEHLVVTP